MAMCIYICTCSYLLNIHQERFNLQTCFCKQQPGASSTKINEAYELVPTQTGSTSLLQRQQAV